MNRLLCACASLWVGTAMLLIAPGCEMDGPDIDALRNAEENQNGERIIHTPRQIDEQITITNDIRPIQASTNRLPGSIRHSDKFLTQGRGTFRRTGERPAPALRIRGIYEPPGTKTVQVDVSRDTPADIFGDVRRLVDRDARIVLVDARGSEYRPIGYLHEHREGITLLLEPTRLLESMEEIPMLPTAGPDRLRLIFRVTETVTISSLNIGDMTVGRCNVLVK